jgi:ribosomal protein L37AE/L43A
MDSFLAFIIGLIVGLAIAEARERRPTFCPKCKTLLPFTRIPTSLHQLFLGGWTCQKCGAEVDKKGNLKK